MLLRHLLAAFLTALVLTLGCLGAPTWAVQTPNTSISLYEDCYDEHCKNASDTSDCQDCCDKFCNYNGIVHEQCLDRCPVSAN